MRTGYSRWKGRVRWALSSICTWTPALWSSYAGEESPSWNSDFRPAMRVRVENVFVITVAWDEEAKVWFVEDSDIPGLAAEAPTEAALKQLLWTRVPELLELNKCSQRAWRIRQVGAP